MSGPAAPAPRPGEAGFTLVELLVASAILALVASLMLGGMRFVGRATASADARREAVESTVAGLGLLRLTLGRALPLHARATSGGGIGDGAGTSSAGGGGGQRGRDRLVFEGGAGRVRFATFEPDHVPGWPLAAYEYALTEGPDGRVVLAVRRAALDPSRPDLAVLDEAPAARPLLGFAGPVRLAYYGAQTAKDTPGWRARWSAEAELLPRAVRVGPAGGEPGWPDFVVPLAIDTPAACLDADAARDARGCGR